MNDFIFVNNIDVVYQVRKIAEGNNKKNNLLSIFKSDYEQRIVLNNLSFSINESGITSIIGKNGAGKTTLIKAIVGIIHINKGSIFVLGNDIKKRNHLYQIGVLFSQKSSMFLENSLIENLKMTLAMYNKKSIITEEIKSYIFDFKLEKIKDKAVKTYSLGERIKAEIINLFSYKPRLLFLDEPTIGLDLQSQKYVREMLKQYSAENHAHILLTSHNSNDILELSDEIYFLNNGYLEKIDNSKYDSKSFEFLEKILC